MNDPEPPGIDHRKISPAVKKQSGEVEQRNRNGRIKKERGHFPLRRVWISPGRGNGSKEQAQPQDQSAGQQELPSPAQLEILPSLVPEPEPQLPHGAADAQRL